MIKGHPVVTKIAEEPRIKRSRLRPVFGFNLPHLCHQGRAPVKQVYYIHISSTASIEGQHYLSGMVVDADCGGRGDERSRATAILTGDRGVFGFD
jgi:hypothetical protein